jgi:xanthine dehydrogenase YagR molybdenum-binding subunit
MVEATRRGFLRASVTGAGVAMVTGATGCAHHPDGLRGEAAPGAAEPEPRERVSVTTTVNGKGHTLEVDPEASALEVVRDTLKLRGSKLSCGHGACGACTMQLDGTPVVTCLLPATALHGRRVTTVEGLARGGALHPVQRAFMAEDALQCGYCTPGFVVEAAPFVDAWRKANGDTEPSRDEVAAALSGHLCRCAAYDSIYAAVQKACAGAYDEDVGAPPRYEALQKVTGKAEYTVDVTYPDMLVARALHAPFANADVTRLDWSRALLHPGVHGAVDLLGESRRIRHAGQEIMALAAVDERTADEALALVEVEYAREPAAIGMAAAMAPDAPLVYRSKAERRKPPNAAEAPVIPQRWSGNLRGPMSLLSKRPGEARRAVEHAKDAGRLVQAKYTTAAQCHTCLEPHAAVAKWEGRKLTLHLSTQAVTIMARDIAEHFGLDRRDVRVIAEHVGGGFGSKATLGRDAIIPIELSRLTGRPVRYALERRHELMIGGYRPASEIDLELAADRDGDMTGLRATIHSDAGVAVGHIVGIMMRLVYPVAPRELVDFDVLTHAPAGKPFRGPGGPMAYFALEQAVDAQAHMRGEDPIALRRRWDPNPVRARLYDWAAALPAWRERGKAGADKGRFRRGVGLACASWFAFAEPKSRVELYAGRDGVKLFQGTQDMGNGTRTVLAAAVAGELGLDPHDVDVRIGDSRFIHGPMSGGSRTTASVVPAAVDACAELKAELVRVAEDQLGCKKARIGASGVDHEAGTTPWKDVLAKADEIRVVGKRRRDEGGYFLPPIQGIATERAVGVGVTIIEVEVDARLGRVRPLHAFGGIGVGKIVSPVLATSQAKGGIIQALSYALYEERRLDPHDGFLLTAGLEDYRIAGIGDVPPIEVHFEEEGYEKIRGRSVGLGELVTLSPPAALANAVFNATGFRPQDLPMRPDRMLKGVAR